jgi:hypothetical protein
MKSLIITLSEQDLAGFLEENTDHMEAYRAELERRTAQWAGSLVEVDVEISRNALEDKIITDDGSDVDAEVQAIMNLMGNDWNWLEEVEDQGDVAHFHEVYCSPY